MRKIREVLRLRFERGLGHRAIAASCAIGKGTVCEYLSRAREAGLTWEQAKELSDAEVERRLFHQVGRNEPSLRAPIDFVWVHRELRRTGVTLQLLWLEYQEALTTTAGSARPYQYSQFCDLYSGFRDKLEPSMRQTHRAGEKAFVDTKSGHDGVTKRALDDFETVIDLARRMEFEDAVRWLAFRKADAISEGERGQPAALPADLAAKVWRSSG